VSIEKESKNFDYEKIEENLNIYHDIWFGDGYRESYELDEKTSFNTPFQMMEYIKETGSEEEKKAAEAFENILLEDEPIVREEIFSKLNLSDSKGYIDVANRYFTSLREKDFRKYTEIVERRMDETSNDSKVTKAVECAFASNFKEREEIIDSKIREYNDIWFGKGYRKEYKLNRRVSFKSPFEMIEHIRKTGTADEKYAVNVFARSIFDNPKSFEYLKTLTEKEYDELVESNYSNRLENGGKGINYFSKHSGGYLEESKVSGVFQGEILKRHFKEVVEKLGQYQDIWLSKGYSKGYKINSRISFRNPFEMIDRVREKGSYEEKYAADIFERTLLEDPTGYQYLNRLHKNNPQRYKECIERTSNEKFWHTKKGSELLNTYAFEEGEIKGESITSTLIKEMLDEYLQTYEIAGDGQEREEKLKTLRPTLNRYFSQHSFAHLAFWSSKENVYALHMYEQSGESLPINTLQNVYKEFSDLDVEDCIKDSERKIQQYERFNSTLELYRTPGFVENKYEEFREHFLLQLRYPTPKEDILDSSWRYRGIEILKRIGEFSKDKDSRFNILSERFMSNLLFDKQLYSVVDAVRRYEINLEKSKEKHSRVKETDLELGITYSEILDKGFNNPKYLSWDWFRKEGSNVLRSMHEYTPYMYMDVIKRYVDMYCFDENMQESERADIRKILMVLFSADVKQMNQLLFKGYTEVKDSKKHVKGEKAIDFLLGKEDGDVRLEENLEFFESTKEWSLFFKSREFNRDLVELFNKDNELFNYIINSLMRNAPNSKDSNYFDNLRMINLVGKKLSEQYKGGAVTVVDYLGEEREEIEKRIVMDAKRMCTIPQVRFTVNIDREDPDVLLKTLYEYLSEYSQIVDIIDLDEIEIYKNGRGIILETVNFSEELSDSLKVLGINSSIEGKKVHIDIENEEEFLNRILGILVSPSFYEWVEDDKGNDNPENENLRTLFFVPTDLKMVYKHDSSEPFLHISFTPAQRKHFIQHYLQSYLYAKHTTGDKTSLNTVLSCWLIDHPDLRNDAYVQSDQLSEKKEKVWKDLEQALNLTFEYERFNKSDILEKLLLAVNIEQLLPLVNNDRFQTALLAASIIKSTLDIAKEESVFKGIMQTSATLQNEFEGTTSLTYLSHEKKERVNKALKSLGFNETDEGLQMFRNMWINFWYVRGYRGEGQTLSITSAGIEISNPKRNMYEYEKRKSETEQLTRKYGGGQDRIMISWSQIRDIKEVELDLIPSKDILVNAFTTLASVAKKDSAPEIVRKIQNNGPANIRLKLPGRTEPLCEIFAVHEPKRFWQLLQDLSKLMVDEEASENALELLKTLEKN